MFLLILGILIFCIGFVFNKNEALYKFSKPTKYAGVLIFFIGLISNCFVQVDAGQVGVKKMFGKIQNDVLESDNHRYFSFIISSAPKVALIGNQLETDFISLSIAYFIGSDAPKPSSNFSLLSIAYFIA